MILYNIVPRRDLKNDDKSREWVKDELFVVVAEFPGRENITNRLPQTLPEYVQRTFHSTILIAMVLIFDCGMQEQPVIIYSTP